MPAALGGRSRGTFAFKVGDGSVEITREERKAGVKVKSVAKLVAELTDEMGVT